jgi:hypothetical protein
MDCPAATALPSSLSLASLGTTGCRMCRPMAGSKCDLCHHADDVTHKAAGCVGPWQHLTMNAVTTLMTSHNRLQDVPKPTMALEYTFGRRPHSNNLGKDIAHLWELGGGAFLTQLMDSVITASSLRALSCVVVVDLSKPSEMWARDRVLLTSATFCSAWNEFGTRVLPSQHTSVHLTIFRRWWVSPTLGC